MNVNRLLELMRVGRQLGVGATPSYSSPMNVMADSNRARNAALGQNALRMWAERMLASESAPEAMPGFFDDEEMPPVRQFRGAPPMARREANPAIQNRLLALMKGGM